MILLLLAAAAAQSASPSAARPEDSREARYQRCVVTAESDPAAARAEALRWAAAGGSWFARQCAGLAYTQERNWPAAAGEFEAAAKAAELGHDARAVARLAIGVHRASVSHGPQAADGVVHHLAARRAVDRADQPHAAGVALGCGIIGVGVDQPLPGIFILGQPIGHAATSSVRDMR